MIDMSISSPFKFVSAVTDRVHSRDDAMPIPGLGCKGLAAFALISWSQNFQE